MSGAVAGFRAQLHQASKSEILKVGESTERRVVDDRTVPCDLAGVCRTATLFRDLDAVSCDRIIGRAFARRSLSRSCGKVICFFSGEPN